MKIKHEVFCYECRKKVTIEVAGDLYQYTDTILSCPCKEEDVIPKPIPSKSINFGLFHIASLEPPSDIYRWLRSRLD